MLNFISKTHHINKTWLFIEITYHLITKNQKKYHMKKNLLILFAVGMMVTVKPTMAQESVRFFGAEQAYPISTERLDEEFSNVEVFTNNLPQDLQYLWDEYCVRFPSKGTHELAVAVMKTNRGLPVFVQQTKTGKIKRLVIFSKGYGWIEAGSEARKFLEKYFNWLTML